MKIKLFEATGLDEFQTFIQEYPKVLSIDEVKEMLKMVNLSFSVENANRLVSTLLCELGFSYVQQSQRYVRMNEHGYYYPDTLKKYPIYEEGRELINQAFELYQQMTKIKDGVAQKGRPKKKIMPMEFPLKMLVIFYLLPVKPI